MSKAFAVFFALTLLPLHSVAQSSTGDLEQIFEVSASQTWTDTGIDLKTGDLLKISATSMPVASGGRPCDPKGEDAASADLPLASASAGALIARLHADETPSLVGTGSDLHVTQASHLFLGINAAGTPPCQGGFSVTVEVTSAVSTATSSTTAPSSSSAAAATTPSTTTPEADASQEQTRGQQLKSQLSAAAQVFMQGQFGMGKPAATGSGATSATSPEAGTATNAVSLDVSKTALDGDLRKDIDNLPRRVNDQSKIWATW